MPPITLEMSSLTLLGNPSYLVNQRLVNNSHTTMHGGCLGESEEKGHLSKGWTPGKDSPEGCRDPWNTQGQHRLGKRPLLHPVE